MLNLFHRDFQLIWSEYTVLISQSRMPKGKSEAETRAAEAGERGKKLATNNLKKGGSGCRKNAESQKRDQLQLRLRPPDDSASSHQLLFP